MSITYIPSIPAANDNPSNDQPNMEINTNSINQIWGVDHVSFNSTSPPSGTHKQVTFTSENTPSTPIDPSSVLYTGPGTASSIAELFYVNQNATLLTSCVKAFGVFTATSAPVSSFLNQYNCASISGSAGSYTITLKSNVVTGNNIIIFIFQKTVSSNYSFSNPTLTIGAAGNGDNVSFVILQA